jgi:hypothetical protein
VLRIGIETGPAVVGPLGGGAVAGYGAVGEVVGTAALLQSVARAGSVLVGPATCAATEGLFEWGPSEEVALGDGTKPLVASYLEGPKARATGLHGHLGGRAPLAGRQAELAVLDSALRDALGGRGSVVVVVGEAGLGKTRLVAECRKRFMAWAGAVTGRLPLWLEGRAASYASTTPYGLYQQLLAAWVGVATEAGEDVLRPALERALSVVMGNKDLWPLLARMMGLAGGAGLVRLPRSRAPSAPMPCAGRHNGDGGGDGSCPAHAGAGCTPSGAGTSRRGPRAWRSAAPTRRSRGRPSRRPRARAREPATTGTARAAKTGSGRWWRAMA